MKPIEFPEQNAVLAKDQPEYSPLPICHVNEPEGRVISVWELSPQETELIGRTRKIYFTQMTFNKPPMPVFLSVVRGDVFQNGEEDIAKPIECRVTHNVTISLDFLDRIKALLTGKIFYNTTIYLDRECRVLKDDGGSVRLDNVFVNFFRRKRKNDLMQSTN